VSDGNTHPLGSNGGVAVGLPHRNSSAFKQTLINQREVKMGKDRNPGLRSEGPFSRREEGWELGEEKSNKSKRERKRESLNNRNKKARRPKSTGLNELNNHMKLISK
jgi:hypothetical protein